MPTIPTIYKDPLRLPEVLLPRAIAPDGRTCFELSIQRGKHRYHSELKETDIWGYNGIYPGPTIDISTNACVELKALNCLAGQYPFVNVGSQPLPDIRWTVLHFHGGVTPPASDGWSDDGALPGQEQIYNYPRQPRAGLFWYHDHANMITRLNVYAGLAGLFILRDETDDQLVKSGAYALELPLLLQGRSFEVVDDRYSGNTVYPNGTVDSFVGDFSVVNGTLWPHVNVPAGTIRLRLLNGSNGRIYALKLRIDGNLSSSEFLQIGSDGGLMRNPTKINAQTVKGDRGIVLAPGERADVLVDLSAFAGRRIELVDGNSVYDQVVEFRVSAQRESEMGIRSLTQDCDRPNVYVDDTCRRRSVLLHQVGGHHGSHKMHMINGRMFHDGVDDIVKLGDTEIWEFINTTGETHPMHLHLVQFEVLSRQRLTIDQAAFDTGVEAWLSQPIHCRPPLPPGVTLQGNEIVPDANEVGPKDVVRCPGRQVTRIAAKFEPYTGKYMYHCHILEHEDMEMMRPFLVVPRGLPLMEH